MNGAIGLKILLERLKNRRPIHIEIVFSDEEIKLLHETALLTDHVKKSGKRLEQDYMRIMDRTMLAFDFAIETAMRTGEIAELLWGNADLNKRTAYLPTSKNNTARKVPLSSKAIKILKELETLKTQLGDVKCFNLTSDQISSNFAKNKRRARLHNLNFHDTRHEACTRLARKLSPHELARMLGHKNLSKTMVYYNETAENIALKLD